ncbi:hypothetical protein ACFFMP_11455 [Pseudoroseomonas cervicalis]|uniref:hypothetical protein n=1 Tax=Teichococcus cervicalis TaxID=204525 RepID=UPI0022F16CA8|nr:hypothetical protein [Pseudoroseomonas cervicalis]WBV43720.1 hypothetical protein PFY06_03905 [Pseudoroseomonas cervicalis]
MNPLDLEPQTLATAAQAPMLAILAWMLHALRRQLPPERCERGCERPAEPAPDAGALARTRDELAAFKLEVARTYVPLSLIRDVDQRLSQQLLRIEEKLDVATRAATAAAALQSAQPPRGWRGGERD